jgi:hypothetical protein
VKRLVTSGVLAAMAIAPMMFATSCTTPPANVASSPSASVSASEVASVEPPSSSAPSSTAARSGIGPAAASAPRAEHEKKLIALLSGAEATDAIEINATNKGESFEPRRYQHLTSGAASIPKISSPKPTVVGSLPYEVIVRIVRQNFGRFRACYEKGQITNPELSGKVVFDISISAKGETSQVKLSSETTLSDSKVNDCIVRAMRTLSWPEGEGGKGTEVHYTVQFAPPGAP